MILQLKQRRNRFAFVIFILGLTACTSAEKKTEIPERPTEKVEAPAVKSSGPVREDENVDYVALQRSLGLERSNLHLGFQERLFDTCDVGYGFSKSNNCRQRYFVVVHFQLMCRDSEGTVSEIVRAANLQANAYRNVRWTLKDASGSLSTDSEGYGQLRMLAPKSQKQQRLKLAVDTDFLYLRAGEVNKIVTPKSWCK